MSYSRQNFRFSTKHSDGFNGCFFVGNGLGDHVPGRIPDCVIRWKQLFDSDLFSAAEIACPVGNPEGTGFAEHPLELINIQNVSRRQGSVCREGRAHDTGTPRIFPR
jgi:hypothetical protein